jgi:hypothetical protein
VLRRGGHPAANEALAGAERVAQRLLSQVESAPRSARCWRGSLQPLRPGVLCLLAFERGSPVVALLLQIILAPPQSCDDCTQFSYQGIRGCIAFDWRRSRADTRKRERRKDRNKSWRNRSPAEG